MDIHYLFDPTSFIENTILTTSAASLLSQMAVYVGVCFWTLFCSISPFVYPWAITTLS